jgi:hypothetical protein
VGFVFNEEKKLFLDGYLHPSMVRNFIKYLKGFSKIEYFIEFPNKEIKTNIRNWHVNLKKNNFKYNYYFNSLSRVKQNNTWINTDILPFRDISYITLNSWKSFDNILKVLKDYCFIHIQHRSFHNTKNDLYSIILDSPIKFSLQNGKKFKPEKKNKFGKTYSNYTLIELERDLLKVGNSFGNKVGNSFGNKVGNSFGNNVGNKVGKDSYFKRVKSHLWKNKSSYIDWGTKLLLLAGIKKIWDKTKISKEKKKRKLDKEDSRIRKILREELSNLNK